MTDEHTQVSHWWTGTVTECPTCGQALVLPVYRNTRLRYAHCPHCERTFEVTDIHDEVTEEMTR